jgi:two-component system phosphate regulon response regulator PhoB
MLPAAMNEGARVLVVEHQASLRMILKQALDQEYFVSRTASTGKQALREVERFAPDLIVLDVSLPDFSGLEVARQVRASSSRRQPSLVLLSNRDQEIDRVVAFEVGADDYVVKPFSTRELVLRVKAQLRARAVRPAPARRRGQFEIGSLAIDSTDHRVTVEGNDVAVTLTEMRLLVHLASAQGRVCARKALLAQVWADSLGEDSRTLDTHVRRLRHKLGTAGSRLQTVRGLGYRLQ